MSESNRIEIEARSVSVGQIDTRVEQHLRSMNLSEKVGQMTQLTLAAVSCRSGSLDLDRGKLREALVEYGVGSIFNVCERAFSVTDWHRALHLIQEIATEETRLGIPVLYGIDSVHGANYTVGASIFPHNLGLAATWNPAGVKEAAIVAALETRSSGIPWTFAPVLDLGRQPLWSRFCETFGEDTHLVTVMGRAAVEGLERRGSSPYHRVAACAKHFIGYGTPQSGKDRTPAYIPDHVLQDWFIPPFHAAIAAGVSTVMVNSGEVNGRPVHASKELLTNILRGRLGFEGVIVSDWEDVAKLHTVHHVARSEKEAVYLAVDAGIDVSMTPRSLSFHRHLVDLVQEGAIPEARIDDSVRRILKLKFDLGLFEAPYPNVEAQSNVGSDRSAAINLKVSRESITLLKNVSDTLPLDPSIRILITGPAADSVPALHGPWSYTWQGCEIDAYPPDTRSLRQELSSRGLNLSFRQGTTWDTEVHIGEAVAAAKEADVAIVCLGEEPSIEKPGDIDELNLDGAQLELAAQIAQTGTPAVLVMLTGRPRVIREIVDDMSAIVLAYQPGSAGAAAIADVLLGVTNPSGKLPFSYPRYANDLLTYDHRVSERLGRSYGLRPDFAMDAYRPQFDFGFGLSYSRFRFDNLHVDPPTVRGSEHLTVRVDVENVSDRRGAEVVQVYVGDDFASVTPPVKRLKAFKKIWLDPGEVSTVEFHLSTDVLRFTGAEGDTCLEDGIFTIQVAELSRKLTLQCDHDAGGSNFF